MFQHQKTSANDGMAFRNIAMEQNPCVSSGCSSLPPRPRLPFSAAKLPLELRPLEDCAVGKTLPLTPDPAPNAASPHQMLCKVHVWLPFDAAYGLSLSAAGNPLGQWLIRLAPTHWSHRQLSEPASLLRAVGVLSIAALIVHVSPRSSSL